MEVDNAKAFKSKEFEKELSDIGISLNFGAPYIHTSVGTVERHIYVRPFLMEGNLLKFVVRRAVKTMRFTYHAAIKTIPYQMLTNQRPRNVLDKIFDLEHPGMTLTTVVKNLTGRFIGSETKVPKEIEAFESSRQWGRSRNLQELRRYVNEGSKILRAPKPNVRKFVVEKTRVRKGWDSEYQDKPLLVTNETKHTVTVGNRTLHKKDVADIPDDLVPKLFQPKQRTTQATKLPEYKTGAKKTVYKKDGKFVKESTAGAIAYEVDTLGEEKTTVKSELSKRLAEMRENSRIKKKIQQENEKAEREAQEHWLTSNQSFEFTIPSIVGSPDETLLNAVLSPEKSSETTAPESGNSDSNNNTPKVSPVKSAKRKIALVATSSNVIQLYQQPTSLPPVGTILSSLVGKKTSNKLKNKAKPKDVEFTECSEIEESKVRKSERLKKANSVTPMGGVKYV